MRGSLLPCCETSRVLLFPRYGQNKWGVHLSPRSSVRGDTAVGDLIEFCKSKPESLKHKELFLLRNLSRGKGIGFFEDTGFYPDFILWVTEGDKQRLVFIEPHGMRLESHPDTNPKVNLHLKLKAQEAEARKKSKLPTLSLDAFIISATPFDDLHRQHGIMWNRLKYAESHIFFGDEEDKGHIRGIIIG